MRPARGAPSRLAPWMSSTSDSRPRRVQSPGAKSYKEWLAAERARGIDVEDASPGQSEAAQDFKKWLRSTPEAKPGNPSNPVGGLWAALEAGKSTEDELSLVQGAVRKEMVDDELAAPLHTAAAASDEIYTSGTPEAFATEDASVDPQELRLRLVDEKAKRELVERQVGALRLQVAKCDRTLERAVDRAVKQTIDVHEEAFRKSRELLQQQLAVANNERELAAAQADDFARELSALRNFRLRESTALVASASEKASQDALAKARYETHDLRRRLNESEATASRLEREQESVYERLCIEEGKRQQIEAHAVSLEKRLSQMIDLQSRTRDRELDVPLGRTTVAESLRGSIIPGRNVVDDCGATDDERAAFAAVEARVQRNSKEWQVGHEEDVQSLEKLWERELQGYKFQVRNLVAELAEANVQVADQSELMEQLEAREKATMHDKESVMEQLLAAKTELNVTRDAAIQLVALRAELAAFKVRTSADMESQRMLVENERKGHFESIRQLKDELARRDDNPQVLQGIGNPSKEEGGLIADCSDEDEIKQMEGWEESHQLAQKLEKAMHLIRELEEETALYKDKVSVETAARASLENRLAEQQKADLGMYEIINATIVRKGFSPDSTKTMDLCCQTIVHVLEMKDCEDCVRARIEDPPGWISIFNKATGVRYAVKELDDRLRPLHDEYLQFLDERGDLLEQLAECEAQKAMIESRVSTEITMRKELEEKLLVANDGDALSDKEAELLRECRSMAEENEIEQQRNTLRQDEIEHLQRDLADMKERLRISDSLVIELRSGVCHEDNRRHDQEQIYKEIIAELRRAVANEEVQSQHQARIFTEEWDEMSRFVAVTEQSEYLQAEALRREREWWTRRLAELGHDAHSEILASNGDMLVGSNHGSPRRQNISASSISMEMPSIMSPDLVGAAGLVGNLHDNTIYADNGLTIEPSASTISGTTGQTEEMLPFISSSFSFPPFQPRVDVTLQPLAASSIHALERQTASLGMSDGVGLHLPPVEGYPSSRTPTPSNPMEGACQSLTTAVIWPERPLSAQTLAQTVTADLDMAAD